MPPRSRAPIREWPGFSSAWAICSSRSASIGRTRRAVHAMQLAVRLAAADAGVWACDTVYGTVSDPDGYTREAEAARRLGFIGKSCIHPTQIPLANAVFRPSDAEIAEARRVVEAARGAEAKGVGAFLVDGRMIDLPFIKRAEAILGAARRLGLPAAS